MPTAEPPPTLFGRERELAVLDGLLAGVDARGASLVLTGDAGIGKSALLAATRRSAEARGMRVLSATGVQAEQGFPYAGLHQLLHPVLDQAVALPGPQRAALDAALGMADEHVDPYLTGLAVLGILGDVAETTPLLVVAEDAHWLDRPTCAALAFAARRLEADAIVLLVAVRGRAPRAIATAGLATLEVGPLGEDACLAVLADRVPGLDHEARRRVLGHADGNPLALVELGADAGVESTVVPLTTRLERAFAARVASLPPATQAALLVLALSERSDGATVLRATAALAGDGVTEEVLTPAIAAGLTDVDGASLRFRHPLVRSAIEQSADPGARRAAHAALAVVLADEPDRSLWHRVAATEGPDDELAAALVAAARRARLRGAPVTAAELLERAAGFCTAAGARTARLLDAAELALDVGRYDLLGRLLAAAGAGDPRAAGLATLASHHPLDPRALGTQLDRAERLVEAGEAAEAVEAVLTVAWRCWWTAADLAIRARTIALARRVASAERVLVVLALVDAVGHGRELADGLAAVEPAAVDPDDLRLLAIAAAVCGAWEQAAACGDVAVDRLRAQGRYGTLAPALAGRAWAGVVLGDIGGARAAALELVRIGAETDQPLWAVSGSAAASALEALRGDRAAAEDAATAAERFLPGGLADGMLGLIAYARAVGALADGRAGDAVDLLLGVTAPGFLVGWIPGLLADAAVACGREAEARSWLAALPVTELPAFVTERAVADALLDPSDAGFASALATVAGVPLRWAQVQLAYGAWLRRERRLSDARAPLRAARDAFDALGATALAERARRDLRAAGEASRSAAADPKTVLSPHELLIAEMAAQGLSNREIGQALYLSPRTIGSHLYRIFPKLGIISRGELRGALGTSAAA